MYHVITFSIKKRATCYSGDPKPETYFMAEEHAVSLKLSTFWISQPDVWFAQAEVQFTLRKIPSDETMYYNALAAFDQATGSRFMDLISQPPTTGKYKALKTCLLDMFGLSAQERVS